MTAGRPAFALKTAPACRRNVGLAVMLVLGALWLAAASRVHVNASWSDGAWGYAVLPPFGEDPKPGDMVLFEPPRAVGSELPYLKTVRGVPGMTVSVDEDRTVRLDGIVMGRAKARALDGRPLTAVASSIIPPGHFYVHADHADSHDSRYAEIGLVPRGRILGRAVPMPDIPWLGLEGPLVGPEDVDEAGAATILPYPQEGAAASRAAGKPQ